MLFADYAAAHELGCGPKQEYDFSRDV